MLEESLIKLLLETPSIGALVFALWLKGKENKAMSDTIQRLAEVINKQSGILIGLTKGDK